MRLLSALALLAMTAATANAQTPPVKEWQLLAIDGQVVDFPATLTIGAEGEIAGKAPCNRYHGRNLVDLPELNLGPLMATRMACDRLAEEQAYFDTLSQMTRVDQPDARTLILTGPDGRSMEFADDLNSTLTRCTTCPPKD
jgi:heat shock protein HslJ